MQVRVRSFVFVPSHLRHSFPVPKLCSARVPPRQQYSPLYSVRSTPYNMTHLHLLNLLPPPPLLPPVTPAIHQPGTSHSALSLADVHPLLSVFYFVCVDPWIPGAPLLLRSPSLLQTFLASRNFFVAAACRFPGPMTSSRSLHLVQPSSGPVHRTFSHSSLS